MTEREAKNRARNLLWDSSVLNDGSLASELLTAWREGYAMGLAKGSAEGAGAPNGIELLNAAYAGAREMRDDILECLAALQRGEHSESRREYLGGIIDAIREMDSTEPASFKENRL